MSRTSAIILQVRADPKIKVAEIGGFLNWIISILLAGNTRKYDSINKILQWMVLCAL